ncbi:uroporphyrinogen decarboxylase/cobalamine-independent methonine synthase family protein [Christensenella tenuis]|jgi:hypothetical protein|uniref:Uroporphyrinogen decarboxylase (URO-D) domain-containing protein n=1 Tax=Christensenella tenuis TaxID=2763033 RepID=A0ABR7EH68_9FIRM|nr:hypothetical protein [Christensenella tenuis]MBC5649098.1 hypothetical protein [Christensenella tenuis]
MAKIDIRKDPAAMQTAAGYPQVKEMETAFLFSAKEKTTLRGLAKEVAGLAAQPEMKKKAEKWTVHNDLKSDEPLVFIDPENGWNEIIPPSGLVCSDPLARVWEMHLRKQVYWATVLRDDKVIEPFFDVPYSYTDTGWGIDPVLEGGENGGAYHIKKAIEQYETDFEKLHAPQIILDEEESGRLMDLATGLFDGILTVRRKNVWWWTLGLCFDYVYLRGMEDFMCDCLLEPEWVHRMFKLICDGKLAMLDFLEENGLLASNNGGTYVGSGGFGFTDELPRAGTDPVRTQDMWGFCDAQETAQMAPELYAEFVLPYHKKILERFGLSCYGCCEGYHGRWNYVKTLPHLRRVSVSPWADLSTVPEYLGKNYIASVKPNPAPLAFHSIDEETVRRDCREAVQKTKGGICEFIMKDNNTLGGNPQNAARWVQIMREEIEKI